MSNSVKIGNVIVGGGNKIAIQTMANIKTEYVDKVTSQILALEKAGCDVIRVAAKDEADALAIKTIKNAIHINQKSTVIFSSICGRGTYT